MNQKTAHSKAEKANEKAEKVFLCKYQSLDYKQWLDLLASHINVYILRKRRQNVFILFLLIYYWKQVDCALIQASIKFVITYRQENKEKMPIEFVDPIPS